MKFSKIFDLPDGQLLVQRSDTPKVAGWGESPVKCELILKTANKNGQQIEARQTYGNGSDRDIDFEKFSEVLAVKNLGFLQEMMSKNSTLTIGPC